MELLARLARILLPLAIASAARAYPTSLNLIPVADSMDARALRLEVELDGHPTPFAGGASLQLYTQYGVTNRVEVGLDLSEANTDADWHLNAKWLAAAESDDMPAVAIGLLDANHGGLSADWFAILSKDVAPVRMHAGVLLDDATRGMFGAEYWPGERTGLGADWTTGPGGYQSLGLYQDLGAGVWATLYYARGSAQDDDFVGLNVLWEGRP